MARRRAAESDRGAPASAFRAWPVTGWVCWPAAMSARSLMFLLDDARAGDPFSRSLCSASAAVVLSMPIRPGSDERIEAAALGWAAEHAPELGATARLVVAGVYLGGGHAARLVETARDAPPATAGPPNL